MSVFERIAAVIGRDATLQLIATLGGRRIYIRTVPAPGDLITPVIGLDAARLLSTRFGGDIITLPSRETPADRSRASDLRRRIHELHETRLHPAEIASLVRCSERWVHFVLNGK